MAVKLAMLVKKNITLLLRSKSSALTIIFGPLFLILLMGAAFNTASAYGVIVGAYAPGGGTLTDSLLKGLEKRQMSIVNVESKEQCVDGVKDGIFTVCAAFPEGFTADKGGTVTFFVDPTRQNIVYLVIESLMTEVLEQAKHISQQLAAGVVDTLSASEQELQDKQSLVGEMGENNQRMIDAGDKIHRTLRSMNISASTSSIPFGSLQAEINTLKSGSNATTAADEHLNRIKKAVDDLAHQLNYVDGARTVVLKDAVTVTSLAQENTEYLTALDVSLDRVIRNIRSVEQQRVGKIVAPFDTSIEKVAQERTHLNYLFPTLIALIIMFVGLFLASSLEVREKIDKTYFKNAITPTSRALFVFGGFVTTMLVIMLQLAVMLAAAVFFFTEQILSILWGLIAVMLLIGAVFVFFGMLIGTLFRSEETSMVASLSIGFILLFFSSTILPVEALPTFIKGLTTYTPFYAAHFLLSKMLLFRLPLADLIQPVLVLGGWAAGLMLMVLLGKYLLPAGE